MDDQFFNIFVDTSYVVYHTAFGVWPWYKSKFSIKDDPNFDPAADLEFIAAFEDKFKFDLTSTISHLSLFYDKSRICFATDCPSNDIWRNHYYPEYKLIRKKKPKPFLFKNIFNHVSNTLIPNLIDEWGCKIIDCPCAEGDDIIAVLTLLNKEHNNLIITCDKDIIQLQEYAKIINLDNKILETDLSKEMFILKKALMGDISDNIEGFVPRVGKATSSKMINNKELIKEKFEKYPDAKDNLKRNLRLMDFKYIPKQIKKLVIKKWNELDGK